MTNRIDPKDLRLLLRRDAKAKAVLIADNVRRVRHVVMEADDVGSAIGVADSIPTFAPALYERAADDEWKTVALDDGDAAAQPRVQAVRLSDITSPEPAAPKPAAVAPTPKPAAPAAKPAAPRSGFGSYASGLAETVKSFVTTDPPAAKPGDKS